MGLSRFLSAEASEKYVKKNLKDQAQEDTVKLLLLGIGESGKSTLFKQMKILYGDYEMSQLEMDEVRSVIFSNILDSMQTLLEQCRRFGLHDALADTDPWKTVETAMTIDVDVGAAVAALWSDVALQATWARRSEFYVIDSAAYFFDNITRIAGPGYMSKSSYSDDEKSTYQQDYLHARLQTTSIQTERLKINGKRFEFIDVGGQKSERRRWLQFFGHVTAILFVASISDFDTTVQENPDLNRMLEALHVFSGVVLLCGNIKRWGIQLSPRRSSTIVHRPRSPRQPHGAAAIDPTASGETMLQR